MTKSKLALLQMRDKRFARKSVEFCKSSFCKTPETLDAVCVALSTRKFVLSVIYAIVIVTVQNQPIIRISSVGMNCHFALNYRHKAYFERFGKHISASFLQAKMVSCRQLPAPSP